MTQQIKINKRCPSCNCKLDTISYITDKHGDTRTRIICNNCAYVYEGTWHDVSLDNLLKCVNADLKNSRKYIKERFYEST